MPPTVLRDGPYGEGMCQLWIEAVEEEPAARPGGGGRTGDRAGRRSVEAEVGEGRTALLVHADDERLRRLAVLDAVINNADRKGGHLLPAAGRPALRHRPRRHLPHRGQAAHPAVGLGGRAAAPDEAVETLGRLADELAGDLGIRLAGLLTAAETAALRDRVAALLAGGRHPEPGGEWPAIPWPPV